MIDILIRNGLIADGTGNPAYTADLAIEGDRIAGIGRFSGAQAAVTIDAIGKVVCPGFIDVHLHSEVEMLAGRATAGVQMGVTTELICPDGITFTSIPRRLFDDYYRYIFGIYGPVDVTWDCESISSYLAQFKGRIRNNIACKVPHGVVRLAVKGWQTGPATDDELKAMGRIVRDWMEAGAVAFDTGLGYAPASYSDLRELVYLSKIVAGYGGVYTAHMRNYGPERAASIAETVAIARQAEIPVNIDHFGGTPEIYAEANAARAAGVDITWDAYPYMAGCTLMSYALPTELFRRGAGAVLAALGQRDQRRQLESTLETWFPSNASPFFAYVTLPANKWMEGMRVREVWRQSGKSFVDFYCDLLLEENLAPLLIYPWAGTPEENEARLRHTLTHPLQFVSTDGIYVGSHTHPRGYGAYPRLLGHFVREEKLLTLEDAVRRMTSFPATRFGLADRGLLRKGMAADVVVFDPATIIDHATYEEPRLPPSGIEHVFVNGVAVIGNSQLTANRPGKLVRRP